MLSSDHLYAHEVNVIISEMYTYIQQHCFCHKHLGLCILVYILCVQYILFIMLLKLLKGKFMSSFMCTVKERSQLIICNE